MRLREEGWDQLVSGDDCYRTEVLYLHRMAPLRTTMSGFTIKQALRVRG
jgi:hypothetical protein